MQTSLNGNNTPGTSKAGTYPLSGFISQQQGLNTDIANDCGQTQTLGLGISSSSGLDRARNDAFWQSPLTPVV